MHDVIDAHVHHWDVHSTPRQVTALVNLFGWQPATMHWLARRIFPKDAQVFFGATDHILADYLSAEFAQDTNQRAAEYVHVEADWNDRSEMGPVNETAWLERLDPPGLLAIVGRADLSLGDAVGPVLAAHRAASPRLRYIRQTLSHHPSASVLNGCDREKLSEDKSWRVGYARLAEHDLGFEATVYDHQINEVTALAQDFPHIPIVLSHAGTPVALGGPFGDQGASAEQRMQTLQAWNEAMQRLAGCPNVRVKISGLAMPVIGWGWHTRESPPAAEEVAEALKTLVDHIIDGFGAAAQNRMGGLRQTAIWRARGSSGLPQSLHAPCRDLEPAPRQRRCQRRGVPMEGLPDQVR